MKDQHPSLLLEKFIVRMPDGMRELLRVAAERNNRSMNAEIVNRLDESLTGAGLMPAAEAAERAEKALADQAAALGHAVACGVRDAAEAGRRTATVTTAGADRTVVDQMIEQLQGLGYQVECQPDALEIQF